MSVSIYCPIRNRVTLSPLKSDKEILSSGTPYVKIRVLLYYPSIYTPMALPPASMRCIESFVPKVTSVTSTFSRST